MFKRFSKPKKFAQRVIKLFDRRKEKIWSKNLISRRKGGLKELTNRRFRKYSKKKRCHTSKILQKNLSGKNKN